MGQLSLSPQQLFRLGTVPQNRNGDKNRSARSVRDRNVRLRLGPRTGRFWQVFLLSYVWDYLFSVPHGTAVLSVSAPCLQIVVDVLVPCLLFSVPRLQDALSQTVPC